jgi:histone acetyltransferase (RNA polymerase elongator complex component)
MHPVESAVKPFIIPVFIPHAGCPHQCVFCNQKAITRSAIQAPSFLQIEAAIRSYLNYLTPDRKPVQIAFFGGNFLGIDRQEILRLLNTATTFVNAGVVDSIRFSTRPDTLTKGRLEILKEFPVSTIEIGAQSMNDTVLERCRRGHTARQTASAAYLAKVGGYEVGIQMMVGLPGDDDAGAILTGRKIVELAPDFVRIYPAVVLEGSLLANWYRKGQYTPLSLSASVSLVKRLYLMFQGSNIAVIRMGLQATADLQDGSILLAGPFHPAFGHLVISEIYRDKVIDLLKVSGTASETVTLRVNPKRISTMRGLKNENIQYLKNRFHIRHIDVIGDSLMSDHHITLEEGPGSKKTSTVAEWSRKENKKGIYVFT